MDATKIHSNWWRDRRNNVKDWQLTPDHISFFPFFCYPFSFFSPHENSFNRQCLCVARRAIASSFFFLLRSGGLKCLKRLRAPWEISCHHQLPETRNVSTPRWRGPKKKKKIRVEMAAEWIRLRSYFWYRTLQSHPWVLLLEIPNIHTGITGLGLMPISRPAEYFRDVFHGSDSLFLVMCSPPKTFQQPIDHLQQLWDYLLVATMATMVSSWKICHKIFT